MNGQFDEKLIQKIQDVFDNYEDNQADYGWLELRKKYPEEKRRKPVFYYWISSAAAVLLLALGVWALSHKATEETIAAAKNKVSFPKEKNGTADKIQQNLVISKEETAKAADEVINADAKPHIKMYASSAVSHTVSKKEIAPVHTEVENPPAKVVVTSAEPVSEGSPVLAAVPVEKTENKTDVLIPENTSDEQVKKAASLADIALEPSEKKTSEKNDRKVSFSVYAGSFVNYAEGSSNKINLGAGFASEIALTKNLRLSAGLALSQNDLSFKRDIPAAAQNSFDAVFNNSSESLTSLKVISYDLEGYDASLLGLDIPVNLTYILPEGKNDLFISAGVSSGTFINESYTYHYSSYGPSSNRLPETAPVTNKDEVERSVSGFDFARMLNFSFGMGYPVGKQNKLIVEPFLKYPLKGIGEENLRFGAGGVNLKFNFKNRK